MARWGFNFGGFSHRGTGHPCRGLLVSAVSLEAGGRQAGAPDPRALQLLSGQDASECSPEVR